MQKMNTAAVNPKVSVPAKKGSMETHACSPVGKAAGSPVKGFSSGGEKPAKIKA